MGVQQGSPLSPVSFSAVMDSMTHVVRQKSPSTITVVDVIVIGKEIENEMDPSGTVWLHGVDIAQSGAE